ncbi:MAG: tetratricopeptide repeat protein [Thermoplasmata archaeon]
MPGLQEREEDKSPPENGQVAAYERQLSELLDSLKTDSGNPDLWMEAATVYLALGRRRRASKAYRASINVVNERKSEEAILAAVHRLLHGDYVPALETGDRSPPESAAEDGTTSHLLVQETRDGARDSTPPGTPGQERTVGVNWDPLAQIRQELDPHQTMTCPECNTLLEVGEPGCHGCGQELKEEGESLEGRVDRARKSLERNEDDPDALFTLAAYLAVSGQLEEALECLIRLTALDPRYPGLWWVKARVFLDAGKTEAARASLSMAREIMTESVPESPV